MGMSILLGKNVINISELLDKDIINSLIGTPFVCLYHKMKTLGFGQIQALKLTLNRPTSHKQYPIIIKEMTYLEHKVRII